MSSIGKMLLRVGATHVNKNAIESVTLNHNNKKELYYRVSLMKQNFSGNIFTIMGSGGGNISTDARYYDVYEKDNKDSFDGIKSFVDENS